MQVNKPSAQADPPAAADRHGKRLGIAARVWIVSFVAFFLLGAAWALAMPYDGPPDELQHVTRAYGVTSGQIFAGPANSPVRTAESFVPPGVSCFRWDTTVTANCQQTPGADPATRTKRIWAWSGASGYDPSYYLLVGPALHVWPDMTGVIIARLITDAEISALLACAAAIGWNSRERWLIAGLAVSVTPVVVNLMGAVNPAGVEIGAAIAFWVSLLDLFKSRPVRTPVAAVALLSGALLAVTRGFGVGWLAVIVVVCAFGAGRARLRAVWADRRIRWVTAGIGIACAAAVAWDLAAGPNFDPAGTSPPHTRLGQIVVKELWVRVPFYLDGTVRLTSYGNIPVPQTVSMIWFGALGLIVLGGFWLGSGRVRIQIATIVGVSFFMLLATDISAVRQGFWFSQGRYVLPLLAGAPLIAAPNFDRAGLAPQKAESLLRLLAVALVPLQMVALWSSMMRFQRGYPAGGHLHLNILTGSWLPPLGPILPLALMVAGSAVLAWGLWGRYNVPNVALRFVVVGAMVYAVDVSALWILHARAGLPLAVATTAAFCCAFVANLALNRTFTFGVSGSVGRQGVRLLITAGLNYVSTIVIVVGLSHVWSAFLVSKTIATAFNAVFNFAAYRRWVFQADPETAPLPTPAPQALALEEGVLEEGVLQEGALEQAEAG